MGRAQEWVEAAGSTVDVAVEAALAELGLGSRDEAVIEVISEGKSGILGSSWRAQDAVVKVTAKPKKRRRRRRGRGSSSSDTADGSDDVKSGQRSAKPKGRSPQGSTDQGGRRSSGNASGKDRSQPRSDQPARPSGGKPKGSRRNEGSRRPSGGRSSGAQQRSEGRNGPGEEPTIEEQATIAAEFLRGLLKAFGLEGEVTTVIDDDILRIDVTGDQTEALVGRKGVVMQSVLEITRTVVQRKTFGAPRMRIDINGYGERRREALRIYAGRQADRVKEDGVEIMLEPMNAADRKVVHDAIGEIDGVRSYSEGEDPERAVVIALSDDAAPRTSGPAPGSDDAGDDAGSTTEPDDAGDDAGGNTEPDDEAGEEE